MPSAPSGTVTLLFTDIEGSTRLLQRLGDRYVDLLMRHHAILRDAIAAWGGYEVDTQGDAFFIAFPSARQALRAAAQAQRQIVNYQLTVDGSPIELRVRMGLHTGEPTLTDGLYIGMDVHRASRVASAGHGGQVLLSQTTFDLVAGELPDGVGLRDLGEHRLKDMQGPQRLYQLVIDGLAAEFPPLKTLAVRPNNLPGQPTPLVGREREIAQLRELLQRPDLRVVTLTGPGGTGKTRLAVQVAADALDDYRDGAFFVPLAPVTDPALVPSTIAQALDIKETGEQPILDALQAALRDRHMLLVLDNFEQVIAAAPFVARLLAHASRLTVLATSRITLRLRGEQEFPVPPLALPPRGERRLPTVDQRRAMGDRDASVAQAASVTQYAAVELFIQRAVAVQPSFRVDNDTAPTVAEICYRLDGLPLAIELAAARVKLLPPRAMLNRLENRLKLLTGGPRDLPARQQTLRAAIDWSHDLLSDEEKILLRRLAVFVGGWTLEAAEAVVSGQGPGASGQSAVAEDRVKVERPAEDNLQPATSNLQPLATDVLDGLEALVTQSLVRQVETAEGDVRFGMLETIREYALERLAESGEADALKARHAAMFLALAEEAEPQLRGADGETWLKRLEAEHDNLRAVFEWTRETPGARGETALRLGCALWKFWHIRGHLSEGQRQLADVLTRPDTQAASQRRARALQGAGVMAYLQGGYAEARRLWEAGQAVCAALGDQRGSADALHNLGALAWSQGDTAEARRLWEASLTLKRALGDQWGISDSLSNLALIAHQQGRLDDAQAMLEEALGIMQAIGDRWGAAIRLGNLGMVARSQGRYAEARALYEQSLALTRALGDIQSAADKLNGLGAVAFSEGDYDAARRYYHESLALAEEVGDQEMKANALHGLGATAQRQAQTEAALAYLRESLTIRRALGDRRGLAEVLHELGETLMATGQGLAAQPLLEESLAVGQAIDAPAIVAAAQRGLAALAAQTPSGDEP